LVTEPDADVVPPPLPGDPLADDGVVVLVVLGSDPTLVVDVGVALEVWLSSSSVNFALSDSRVDWAEETDSLSAVGSSEARTWPTVTCSPTVTLTLATCPATWNDAVASLTGSTVPTTSRLSPTDVRTTVAMR
jgi:hypothetical protein